MTKFLDKLKKLLKSADGEAPRVSMEASHYAGCTGTKTAHTAGLCLRDWPAIFLERNQPSQTCNAAPPRRWTSQHHLLSHVQQGTLLLGLQGPLNQVGPSNECRFSMNKKPPPLPHTFQHSRAH